MREAPLAVSWQRYRNEFPIFERKIYFNTCSLGALSQRVRTAMQTAADLWENFGAAAWYGPWFEELSLLRTRFAQVIGAEPAEVALFPSVTTALTAVASCFDYRARPKVVLTDLEFPTTVYQWSVKAVDGVTVHLLEAAGDRLRVPLEAYERAIDERTQLAVASHVYFTSGVIQDIAAVARFAHAQGAFCVIDAYQSVGQLPVDVHAAGVDFLVTGGLKWLLGGPGIAYLYVRRDLIDRLRPRNVGWFAHRDQFAFDVHRFEYADDASRLEGGTPSVAAVYAGRAGLDIILEIGVPRLRAREVELMRYLVAAVQARGLAARIPSSIEELAGIVTIPRENPKAVVEALARRDIIVDFRPGIIRLSPYFYNTADDCDRLLDALVELQHAGIR